MKKTLKKLIVYSLAIGIISTTFATKTFANELDNKNIPNEIKQLEEKYDNLEVIHESELPENVVPLKFNTVEEADAYIKNLEKNDKEENINLGEMDLSEVPRFRTSGVEHYSKYIGFGKINIDASIIYLWSSSLGQNYYSKCTNVNSYVTGLEFGHSWEQTSYAANIVDRGRQLNVTVNGKNNYYILIDTNLTKYYSERKSYSCSWRNP